MNSFKKLASDTAIYGVSSIVGRFLNWWLVPYYSFMFLPGEYGVVTNMYAYVAFLLVLLTYGMETSYFRFASKNDDPEKVYSTSMISLFFTTFSFVLLAAAFRHQIAGFIQYPDHPEYILWFAIILGIDAFTAIPFARLRLKNRPIKFAFIKLVNIAFNIGFNIFFISLCPRILANNPDSAISMIYSADIGVGYVFISNLLASIVTLVLLIPEIFKISLRFDKQLLQKMLSYGFPILIVGLTGMVNQNIDKVLIPFLVPEDQDPMFQLGIYGANYKLAVLMNMFIQAFRYAFEPFFFAREGSKDDPKVYATVMKYFVIFGLLIFLGMVLFIDVVKVIVDSNYHEGLKVVPIVLMANLFYGMYFTLSLWYKLTDKTRFGAYMALTGAAITILLNLAFVPVMGYMGSAIAVFCCFLVMLIMSFVLGKKHYPVPYDLKRIGSYFLAATVLVIAAQFTLELSPIFKYLLNAVLVFAFILVVFKLEKNELKRFIPFINKG
ncbi:polysaccharide biosynthesis C-terminal domain-containing protein [Draconibacterium sp. IB214405]|uniref:oligosaccharide flippase family protein n=1 Tax=Draconibacterium sp. IB214405 TaxID=3097352 RepID=UPI002A125D9F|nr:polysaccharide biosynthesis C-terminal domain-containing protein [Draconibacterium sp. IB214405]MDX8337816.1 polysaccharide biosynthesis C-terminal domain-containing protein [Draconibacterium sp. IB214405]